MEVLAEEEEGCFLNGSDVAVCLHHWSCSCWGGAGYRGGKCVLSGVVTLLAETVILLLYRCGLDWLRWCCCVGEARREESERPGKRMI